MARVQNSFLTKPTDPLEELMSPLTNTRIEEFPVDASDLSTMDDERLDSLLQKLGLSTNGGREAQEKRLRQYIGLRPTPTHGA